jgi:hypothetical protein
MNKSIAALCFVLLAGSAMALETKDVSEQGEGRLYFTGPGYTINLIPQAILLGILAFLAVYFLGIGEPAAAVESGYGAPAAEYGAPSAYNAANRYYETYENAQAQYDETRK